MIEGVDYAITGLTMVDKFIGWLIVILGILIFIAGIWIANKIAN